MVAHAEGSACAIHIRDGMEAVVRRVNANDAFDPSGCNQAY